MKLHTMIQLLFCSVILLFSIAVQAQGEKPNVVIILADDQGWGDLGIHGNTNIKTPNIDSLASRGALFERFYVCAVCAPTRAEFLTGRYHSRGGVRGVSTGQERLNPDVKTIADTFKAAGYATGAFGKWHNGSQWPYHPNARGFDEYYGFTSGHWGQYFDPQLEQNGKIVRGKGYITDDLTDHALDFIERNQGKPFFCYVPFNTPHSPFQVPDPYWDKYKNHPIELRAQNPKGENLDVTRCALAMVENIDWNVGRILERLKNLRLIDNTIVVYFSDNGPNSVRWNGGMKGIKGSVDEGGIRAPFLIQWPGHIKARTVVSQIAGAIDILPTLASLAEVPLIKSQPLDGLNLVPLLMGNAENWPERMIFSQQGQRTSVRTQQYRLDPAGALYDMTADPGQQKDISVLRPEISKRLKQAVGDWRKEIAEGLLPDNRPFPVGYKEFPWTPLPARDGIAHGTIRRSANAPNCSYFTAWQNTNDYISWNVEVHTPGEYECIVYYTCPESDTGSRIEMQFLESRLQGKVMPAFDPPMVEDRDRVPRKGESQVKEFNPLRLGTFHLKAGRGPLILRATEIKGKQVMDVRGIALTLITQ